MRTVCGSVPIAAWAKATVAPINARTARWSARGARSPGAEPVRLHRGSSIDAAAGGARATTTVDVAAPAIAAARRNFERNHLPVDTARFAAEDASPFSPGRRGGERFELVISDPPSFAPSKRALETGLGADRRLHRLCAVVTAPGGIPRRLPPSDIRKDALPPPSATAPGRPPGAPRSREVRGAALDHPVVPDPPEGDDLNRR